MSKILLKKYSRLECSYAYCREVRVSNFSLLGFFNFITSCSCLNVKGRVLQQWIRPPDPCQTLRDMFHNSGSDLHTLLRKVTCFIIVGQTSRPFSNIKWRISLLWVRPPEPFHTLNDVFRYCCLLYTSDAADDC